MKLIRNYLTKWGCYKAGKKITVKGLMIHSVGCPQPKASAFINNWDKADANACVHAIVEPGRGVELLYFGQPSGNRDGRKMEPGTAGAGAQEEGEEYCRGRHTEISEPLPT